MKFPFLKDKGKWLPDEGRYENLAYGQWRFPTLRCKLFGHHFVDGRITNLDEPQVDDMCEWCGLERKI